MSKIFASPQPPTGFFVYGSLKRGECNDALIRDAVSVEPAETQGGLYQLRRGFPAMTLEGGSTVHGEFVRFADMAQAMARLDRLETYNTAAPQNSRYQRVIIEATVNGERANAWAYVFAPSKVAAEGGKPVPGADWHGSALHRYVIRPFRKAQFAVADALKSR